MEIIMLYQGTLVAVSDMERSKNFYTNVLEQKIMMEDAIKWYVNHQDETKYSFKTIINIALKRVSDFGSEYANKTEMVCSQFVYTILAIADFKHLF